MVAIVGAAVTEFHAGRVTETRLLGQVAVEKIFQTQSVAVDDDAMALVVLALATSPCRCTARIHTGLHHCQQQQQGERTSS